MLSQTFLYNMVIGLREAGVDVTVITERAESDLPLFADRLAGAELDFVRRGLTAYSKAGQFSRAALIWGRHPVLSWRLWRDVGGRYQPTKRALKAWRLAAPLVVGRYDVVHFAFSGMAIKYLDALPFLRPAKLLASCRGADEQILPLVEADRSEQLRQLFPMLDKVHCVSTDMDCTVQKYGLRPGQAFVNRPAIRVNQFRRTEPYPLRERGPYRVLSVGRLHWKKGFEDGLRAVRQLLDEGCSLLYDIVGDGPERERLAFAIHELKLGEVVRLKGRQSAEEVHRALAAADVFLLPSISEGLSNAVLEAMAMEVPVVVTAAGGMTEAVADGCEGFVVPPHEPGELANRVRRLLEDASLRVRMGHRGRRRVVDDFTIERQVRGFIAAYQAVLSA